MREGAGQESGVSLFGRGACSGNSIVVVVIMTMRVERRSENLFVLLMGVGAGE